MGSCFAIVCFTTTLLYSAGSQDLGSRASVSSLWLDLAGVMATGDVKKECDDPLEQLRAYFDTARSLV